MMSVISSSLLCLVSVVSRGGVPLYLILRWGGIVLSLPLGAAVSVTHSCLTYLSSSHYVSLICLLGDK
jgi:hypothetical protein